MGVAKICLLLAGALSANVAHAIPVEWRATGTIGEAPPPFLFPFTVNAGDAIAFDYRFDTAAPCVLCESDQASYDGLLTGLSVRVNEVRREIPLTMSSLYLANDRPVNDGFLDAFVLTFAGNEADLGFFGTLALQNVLPMQPVAPLSGVELASLTVPPDPQAFPPSALPTVNSNFFTFSVTSLDGGFNSFDGKLDAAGVLPSSYNGTEVPEPGTVTLMLSGLLGLLFARRSRQRTG